MGCCWARKMSHPLPLSPAKPTADVQNPAGDAYIAYATEDGVVGVIKIRQTLETTPATSPFGLNLSIKVTVEGFPYEICPPDQRPCSALEWVEVPGSVSSVSPIYCLNDLIETEL